MWTDKEKKRINEFLRRANLKVNKNEFLPSNIFNKGNVYIDSLVTNFPEEVERIYLFQDRNRILEILKNNTKVKELVKADPNNQIYFGLVTSIAKIDTNDASEIFTIFKEIISQYYKTFYKVFKILLLEIDKEDITSFIDERISYLKNAKDETVEEQIIKNYMNKQLDIVKDVTDNEIFNPIIEKLNNNIKTNFINTLIIEKRELAIKKTEIEKCEKSQYENEKHKRLHKLKKHKPKDF